MGVEIGLHEEQKQQDTVFNYDRKQAQNDLKNAKTARICGDTLIEKAKELEGIDEERCKEHCKGAVGRHEEALEKTLKAATEAIGISQNTYNNNDPREGKCGENLQLRRSHSITEINKQLTQNGIELITNSEAREADHMLTDKQLTNTAVDNNASIDVNIEQAEKMKELSDKASKNFNGYVDKEKKRRKQNKELDKKKKKTKDAFKNVDVPSWLKDRRI